MIKFEKVSFEEFKKSCKTDINNSTYFGYKCDVEEKIKKYYDEIKLPERSTSGSAGYDFFAPFDYTFFPQYNCKTGMIGEEDQFLYPTGIRFVTDRDDIVLLCMPKSGLGCKYGMRLKNTIGVVDSDYFKSDNEGHIKVKMSVDSILSQAVVSGKAFMQGVIVPFIKTDDDCVNSSRNGGFGSTGV